jgi:DNA-binding response OmpR family regulator/CheY-specific phosphatase CheX
MPVKVLSVDDNSTICFIVNGALKPYDCVVYKAANGEEGLVAAAREMPDLIILDVNMPVMDGVTMLTKLRENTALTSIPVIMLTAWSGEEKVSHIANLGIRDYLVKPFTKDQLVEKVGRAVNLQRRSPAGIPCVTPPPVRPVSSFKGDGFAQRYGLEPMPESVACLAALVAQQDADLNEIGEIIARDKAMSARLLRAANPLYREEEDYEITTVGQALLLRGISCAFLLTMGDLAMRALLRTFQTMLGVKLETSGSHASPPGDELLVLSEVVFSGKAFGRIRLRLEQQSARLVAARVLGVDHEELHDAARVDDAICELTNMVVGNFLSNLADAGLDSKLSSPRVVRTDELHVRSISGGITERVRFHSSELFVFLDVSVDPWHR